MNLEKELHKAKNLRETGTFKQAIKLLEKILSKAIGLEDKIRITLELGRVWLDLGERDKALVVLKQAQNELKNEASGSSLLTLHCQVLITLAELLRQIPGSENEMVDYYQQLITLLEPQIPQRKGILFLPRGKPVMAPDVVDSLLGAYYRIGEFYLIKSEYQKAIDFFIKAINTNSQNQGHVTASYQLLGTSYLRNGNNRKARNVFKMVLKLDSEHQWSSASSIYRDYGKSYYNQGKYKEAIKYMLKALDLEKIKPSELLPDIHEGLGYTYFFLGSFDLAAQHYRIFLEMSELATSKRKHIVEFLRRATITSSHFPGSKKLYKAMTHLESGLAFLEKGYLAEARIEFEQTIALDPDNSSALYGLGRCYYELDAPGQAFSWLKKSLEKQPNYAPAHYFLGQVYYTDKRNFQKALASLKKAIETNAGEIQVADIHLALAASYRELGQIEEALEYEAQIG
jgi:tetratricopeptide (TPR) repeat protein